jgi:alpha-methylacyl-CoA racemase
VELLGIGPGPFCGMVMADMGADVVRVGRKTADGRDARMDVLGRGQRAVALDLKDSDDRAKVLGLVRAADAVIDPFRPGVAERLGLGPAECLKVNPRVVYGRVTGWGQEGEYAQRAGHDINFIALNGSLSTCGNAGGPPVPPVNMLADFGGGGMLLAVGLLAGILHARQTGHGQVVDAAMLDGSALLTAMTHQLIALEMWGPRGTNILDTGSPFYNVYQTADGEWVAVGAVEANFYAELIDVLGLGADDQFRNGQHEKTRWPEMKVRVAEIFASRSRAEWVEAFKDRDACFAPVLSLDEAAEEPHLRDRGTYVTEYGVRQPAPAPRFSLTPSTISGPPPLPGEHTADVLREWGVVIDADS